MVQYIHTQQHKTRCASRHLFADRLPLSFSHWTHGSSGRVSELTSSRLLIQHMDKIYELSGCTPHSPSTFPHHMLNFSSAPLDNGPMSYTQKINLNKAADGELQTFHDCSCRTNQPTYCWCRISSTNLHRTMSNQLLRYSITTWPQLSIHSLGNKLFVKSSLIRAATLLITTMWIVHFTVLMYVAFLYSRHWIRPESS